MPGEPFSIVMASTVEQTLRHARGHPRRADGTDHASDATAILMPMAPYHLRMISDRQCAPSDALGKADPPGRLEG